jgi:class 3 adenylate cyclase
VGDRAAAGLVCRGSLTYSPVGRTGHIGTAYGDEVTHSRTATRDQPASVLPIGTVTFLLTDIEGSTRLWEQQREGMRAALARHDALIERLVAEHGGVVVRPRGEGDSRFAVFAQASAAVAAAGAIQVALHREVWPLPEPLRVRIGLHTGEADLRDGDYYGGAVNRCARLRALAHGGQVLLSGTTTALVRDQLPADIALHGLGTHRLKDLPEPETIFQLLHPELPCEFPPLQSDGPQRGAFPAQANRLIGRERELEEILGYLRRPAVRLLTLTGPGGVGKTRLALAAAECLQDGFAGGTWFVDLSALRDPGLVIPTIAHVLGLREVGAQPVLEQLQVHLRGRNLLLLLDNFEQVLEAGPDVAALLTTCPGLKVLVSSREQLRLSWEHIYPVAPLEVPDLANLPGPNVLEQVPAVALLVQRAQAAAPAFKLDDL